MITYPIERFEKQVIERLSPTEMDAFVDLLIGEAMYSEGRWLDFTRSGEFYWPADRALLRRLTDKAAPAEKEMAFQQAGYLTGLFQNGGRGAAQR